MAAGLVRAFGPREGPSHSACGMREPSRLDGNLHPTTPLLSTRNPSRAISQDTILRAWDSRGAAPPHGAPGPAARRGPLPSAGAWVPGEVAGTLLQAMVSQGTLA